MDKMSTPHQLKFKGSLVMTSEALGVSIHQKAITTKGWDVEPLSNVGFNYRWNNYVLQVVIFD